MRQELIDNPLNIVEEYSVISRREKLRKSKQAYINYQNASPARKESMRKFANLRRYMRIHQEFLRAASNIMEEEQLKQVVSAISATRNKLRGNSHTYVVCPSCYAALKGHPPTKAFKKFTSERCACCDAKSHIISTDPTDDSLDIGHPSNLHIRHTITRAEAITKIHTEHPELFI